MSLFELKEKCLSLSSGLRLAMNVVDLFLTRTCRIQMQIWLGGKSSHN